MFIHDLFEQQERRLVVVYPGRFQPFHLGHLAVFQQLQGRFGRDNVFVGYCSAQRKKESKGDPKYFDGNETRMFMHAVGIDDDRIKDISGADNNFMYGAAGWSKVVPFDPANTVLILAIGAPDAEKLELDAVYTEFTPTGKKSRIPPGKQVGDEKPLKSLPRNLAECSTADQFSYVTVVPEVHKQIEIGGEAVDVSHGRLVRAVWNRVRKNARRRAELLQQMFGRNDAELGRILDKIPVEAITESINTAKKKSLTENDDDLFAHSVRLTNLKSIIRDLDYVANKMVEDPIQYALDVGWDDEDIDDKIIDDVMSTGNVFSDLADTFRRSGLEDGLRALNQLKHHDNPAVSETAILTIDEIHDEYGIDIDQYINETDDDLFAISDRVPKEIQRTKHPLADLGIDYDNYELLMDLLWHCSSQVNINPNDSEHMADIFMWTLEQNYGGAQVYKVINRIINNRAGGDIETQLHNALVADHQQGYLKPVDAVSKLDGVLGKALYAVEDASGQESLKPWGRDRELDENDDDLFAEPTIQFDRAFNEYDEDELQKMGFAYGDHPELDVEIINNYIRGHQKWRVLKITGGEHNLTLHLDKLSGLREDDDELFAPTRAERISNTLSTQAAELKAQWANNDPSWDDHYTVEEEHNIYNYIRRLAEMFRGPNGLIRTLNVIAHTLNDVECLTYKRHAIWAIDEYLAANMGVRLDELFQEYEDQLDESVT